MSQTQNPAPESAESSESSGALPFLTSWEEKSIESRWATLCPPDERRLIGMMLAVKLLIFLFAVQSYHVWMDQRTVDLFGWLEIWNRWDAQHYLTIAVEGYSAAVEKRFLLVFYPLYPWLIRLVNAVVRDPLVSAFLVSTVFSLLAGILLYRLTMLDYSERVARRAVWFLFIFPTSYFLHIGYSESMFLAIVLATIYQARKGRWWMAGALGALAGASRGPGILMAGVLAVEAWRQFRSTRRWQWSWTWIALSPLGFVAYLLVNRQVTGNPWTFMQVAREHFYVALSWPWVSIETALRSLDRNPASAEMVGTQVLLFMLISLVGVAASWWKLHPLSSAWITANWLLVISMSFVISFPRFTLMMFPIFILLALLAEKPIWERLVSLWMLINLGFFISLFVRGYWAF